jgi:hypothetical protein
MKYTTGPLRRRKREEPVRKESEYSLREIGGYRLKSHFRFVLNGKKDRNTGSGPVTAFNITKNTTKIK